MGTVVHDKVVTHLKHQGFNEIDAPEGAETAQSSGVYLKNKLGKIVTVSHAGDVIECRIVKDGTKGLHRPYSPNPVKE